MSEEVVVAETEGILESVKKDFKKFKSAKFSTAYISKLAILTAIAFVLYLLKFNVPFMFPSFLEIQISELPALLAGFSMGPISGCLVIIFKCLLKFPMTSTAFVGEATDILLGIAYVLPASLIYRFKRDRKHALIGLIIGAITMALMAIIVNRYISIPFYVTMFFNGNFNILLSVVRPLYPAVTEQSFYAYYLLLGVLPFNILRCALVAAITFLVYKRLAKPLHWGDTEYSVNKEFKEYKRKRKGNVETATEVVADEAVNDVSEESVEVTPEVIADETPVAEPEIAPATEVVDDTTVKEVANSEKE